MVHSYGIVLHGFESTANYQLCTDLAGILGKRRLKLNYISKYMCGNGWQYWFGHIRVNVVVVVVVA